MSQSAIPPEQAPPPATPDPVPPPPATEENNGAKTILIIGGMLVVGCICFACGIVFGIWAWETGDSWFAMAPPVLSLL